MAVECVHSWQVGRCERSFTAGFNFRPVGSLCWSVCRIHPASSAYVDAAIILSFSVLFAVVAGPSIWQHGSMIIVWRMRGKVIRTDTCCTVLHVTVICTLAWAVLTGDELRLAKCTLSTVYFCFFFLWYLYCFVGGYDLTGALCASYNSSCLHHLHHFPLQNLEWWQSGTGLPQLSRKVAVKRMLLSFGICVACFVSWLHWCGCQ